MKYPVPKTGRKMGLIGLSGLTVVVATVGLMAATTGASGIAAGTAGSSVLSALAARSPGFRVGGIALKSKRRRAALSPVGEAPAGADEVPETPYASVLSAFSEEGFNTPVLETEIPAIGADMFPRDFLPGGDTSPALSDSVTGGNSPSFIGPIGGGPGGGGGGGIIIPPSTPTNSPQPEPTLIAPTPEPTPDRGPPPPPVIPVPEPATWLMLILGFGFVGSRMRRGQNIAATA